MGLFLGTLVTKPLNPKPLVPMYYVLSIILSVLNVAGLVVIGLFSLVMFFSDLVYMVHTPEVKKKINFMKALLILFPGVVATGVLVGLDGEYYSRLVMTLALVFASWVSYEWYMFISYTIFHADVNAVMKGKPTWSIDVARRLHLVR